MKWIKERDALIAQTMAFVQSVTGRTEELLPTGTPPVLPPVPVETAAPPAPEPSPSPEPPQPFQVAPPRLSGDFRTELLDRVATFRKHQERFEREREEYCAQTMAKARAAMPDTGPRRPSGT